jgi:AraC-like DNA-binding protein
MARDESAVGLFAAARRPELVGLLGRLIEAPEYPWKLSDMARQSGMSRASFFKHFTQTAGYQSAAAFARAFKKYTGQQPGAYRRALSARACAPAPA